MDGRSDHCYLFTDHSQAIYTPLLLQFKTVVKIRRMNETRCDLPVDVLDNFPLPLALALVLALPLPVSVLEHFNSIF